MNVRESHRTRHLVIRLDRGDELPASLVRALDEAEARSGFLTGVGVLESAVLRQADHSQRRFDVPCEVVSLTGNVAVIDGAASVRLSAVLSRETELGLGTFGGQLLAATALSLELHVTVFDDLSLTRVADPRTGLPVLEARSPGASILRPAPPVEKAPPPVAEDRPSPPPPAPRAAPPPSPPPPPVALPRAEIHRPTPAAIPLPAAPALHAPTPVPAAPSEAVALPLKPQRPKDDIENFPDVGDLVIHFTFGEATVVGSEGDRIKMRQGRDGRVLEVSLTRLRIELLATEADGSRRFKLHRKN